MSVQPTASRPMAHSAYASSQETTSTETVSTIATTTAAVEPRVPIVISCIAYKGGVGKSSFALLSGYVLSQELGLRVLLVDADFQGSLTSLIDPDFKKDIKKYYEDNDKTGKRVNIKQIFQEIFRDRQLSEDGREAKEVQLTPVPNYHNFYYIPSHREIYKLDHVNEMGFEQGMGVYRSYPGAMTNLFREIGKLNNIEVILIDLSPSPSGLNKAMLWGSDYFFTPYFPDPLSVNTLEILGDVFESGIKNYLNNPRTNFSDVANSKISCLACKPTFLGAFPQNVSMHVPPGGAKGIPKKDIVRRRAFRQPEAAPSGQIKAAKQIIDGFVEQMKKAQLLAEDYKNLDSHIVSKMHSEYTNAQEQCIIVIDTNKNVKRITTDGSLRNEKDEEKDSRKMHAEEVKRVIGALLNNLRKEDLDFLESKHKDIRVRIYVFCNLLGGVQQHEDKIITVEPSRGKRKVSEKEMPAPFANDYPDEEIQQLAQYYVDNADPAVAASSGVLNHVQIGEHRGANIGGRTTIEGISEHIAEEIENLDPRIMTFFLPIGTGGAHYSDASGGGHWSLIWGIKDEHGKWKLHYFDPLGFDIPPQLKEACTAVFGKQDPSLMTNPRVQSHDNSCGAWVVEAIKRIINREELPNPNNLHGKDIHQIREEHQGILYPDRRNAQKKSLSSSPGMSTFPQNVTKNNSNLMDVEISTFKEKAGNLSKKDIAQYLWLNPKAMISNEMLDKVKEASSYLKEQGFVLAGIEADGNCFFNAFLKSLETLSRKTPLLEDKPNKVSHLRGLVATAKGSIDLDRGEEIKEDGIFVTAPDEGDLLARSLYIPIRVVTVNSYEGEFGIADMLTFTDSNRARQDWETIPDSEKPKEYVLIVDLGGHFVYAKPLAT